MQAAIKPLKKVTLSLTAGSEPGRSNLTDSPVALDFIYGVASDGLCPFESVLSNKHEGDTLSLSVPAADAHEYFGHIFQALHQALGFRIMPGIIHLKIQVIAVVDAENREVVKSLAKALTHDGCGGSCGCGC